MAIAHMEKSATHQLPEPHRPWTELLQDWKLDALRRVLDQLQHCCSGPKGHAKSCSITYAVRHVVAADADPESTLGTHLQHMLTGAIANEIVRRDDLLPEFRKRFPGRENVSPAFLMKYVNSRWWCEVLCELPATNCADLVGAVEGAIQRCERESKPRPIS